MRNRKTRIRWGQWTSRRRNGLAIVINYYCDLMLFNNQFNI